VKKINFIPLEYAKIEVKPSGFDKHVFEIITLERSYILKAKSEIDI